MKNTWSRPLLKNLLKRSASALAGLSLIFLASNAAMAATKNYDNPQPFDQWVEELRIEAISKGLNATIINQALNGVKRIERIIELDRSQPEFSLTFWKYMSGAVSEQRVAKGREMYAKNKALVDKISKKYGVQSRFLISFWGLETNFGKYFGSFPLVGALATLAHDKRRAKFFRQQLIAALEIMSNGDIPVDVKASWAGAMGNFQFIPTTYRDFAIDADGDNKRDLWGNKADAFSSAANYLSRSGWDDQGTWGREIKIPAGFDVSLSGLDIKKNLKEWQALGVRRADGRDLPEADIVGTIVLPGGYKGPAFMIYSNFHSILTWNRSIFYAIAIGHLADRIEKDVSLVAKAPANEVALSRSNIKEIQQLLTNAGFDTDGADGIIGRMSRKAIRAYQTSVNLPADAYPSMELLELLRKGNN